MRLNKTLTYCIIEDVEDVILGIQKRMKKFGKWENVGNSREITLAKEIVKNKRPNLLFMDWHIKGGSTYEILDFIESEEGYEPYIIYFTGYQKDEPEIPEKIINDYSVDNYMTKPIWKKLSDSLEMFLEKAEERVILNAEITIEDINKNVHVVKPKNIVSITVYDSQKRTKILYFNDGKEIILKQTFCSLEKILKNFYIDYIYTNKRYSIVTKKYIDRIDNNFVFLKNEYNIPKVEISKEQLLNVKEWINI